MATKITLSTGNVGYVWATWETASETDTTATIKVTAHGYLTNGWVKSTGIMVFITINGTQSSALRLFGNGQDYSGSSSNVKTTSFSVIVNKGTSAKTVDWKVGFWQYTDGVQQTRKHLGTGTANVKAKTSYTVSYKANGGSGAPSAQTKWHGTDLKLSTTKPTRTGYTFLGWATSSTATSANGSYDPGDTYSANAALTLYAVWKAVTYTVTYNANGGSLGSVPATQTKTYGTALTLSSAKPTRANYTFLGWATTQSATTAAYQAGGSYTNNSAATLYAVWKQAYAEPTISGLTVERCDASGNASDSGTYAKVVFDWKSEVGSPTVRIEWRKTSDSAWSSQTFTASGNGATFSKVCCNGALSTSAAYSIRATVEDSAGNATVSKTLFPLVYLMDFLNGGNGIAFGKAASLAGYIESAFHILMEPSRSIQGTYNGTNYNQFQPINANGNCVLGYGMYNAGVGATNLYGNSFSITSKSAPLINGRAYGENKVLWEAVSYLKSDQTAELDEAISAQPHGVVLVFSSYDVSSSTANNYNWQQVFIPKYLASNDASGVYNVLLTMGGLIYHKALYIHDTQIAGYSTNNSSSFSMVGQTVDNRKFVLRKVIGV